MESSVRQNHEPNYVSVAPEPNVSILLSSPARLGLLLEVRSLQSVSLSTVLVFAAVDLGVASTAFAFLGFFCLPLCVTY